CSDVLEVEVLRDLVDAPRSGEVLLGRATKSTTRHGCEAHPGTDDRPVQRSQRRGRKEGMALLGPYPRARMTHDQRPFETDRGERVGGAQATRRGGVQLDPAEVLSA